MENRASCGLWRGVGQGAGQVGTAPVIKTVIRETMFQIAKKKPGGANQPGFSRLAALTRDRRTALVQKHGLADLTKKGRQAEADAHTAAWKARVRNSDTAWRCDIRAQPAMRHDEVR